MSRSADQPPELARLPLEPSRLLTVLEEVTRHDGVAPLSESHLLALRGGAPAWIVLDPSRPGADAPAGIASRVGESVEVAVRPSQRRRGYGRALLSAAFADDADAADAAEPVAVWAHGDLPEARALAADLGLIRTRELLRLERALTAADADLPELPGLAPLPAADAVDAAVTDHDDALRAWLALNAVAFADHPEQGRWTWADVAARVAEPWFDPDVLFLLPGADGLRASLWVKPQPSVRGRSRAEVYVVAVHPDEAGRGLGRAMLDHVLGVLARRGVQDVELYVDGGNESAVRLYRRAGLDVVERHAQYAAPQVPTS